MASGRVDEQTDIFDLLYMFALGVILGLMLADYWRKGMNRADLRVIPSSGMKVEPKGVE